MTSSKFPLYLTAEDWGGVVAYLENSEWKEGYELGQKLRKQLEKLGVKA